MIRDPRAGAVMRSIAVAGVVVAVVVSVVGWRFVNDLDRDLEQSLTIGEDASATLSETIDVADDLIRALDDGLATLSVTLDTVDQTVTDTADLAEATASLAGTLPESFDDVDAALATVESLSGAIDAALRGLSRVPLGPDYDPAVSLPDAVDNLRAAFQPIGDDLDAIAVELATFADGSGELGDRLATVKSDVDRTRRALVDSGQLLDEYRATADRAGELAVSSRADLRRSFQWARVALVLIGLLIAVSQYVPWWLGARLRDARPLEIADDATADRELERVT